MSNNVVKFYSHEQQDEFIYNLFGAKRGGFFLDISCSHPVVGSNTYALEESLGWNGIGFDIVDVVEKLKWSEYRKTKFVQMDATSDELSAYLRNNITDVVDYVSIDVDAYPNNYSKEALEKVINSGIRFKALTFEHEFYKFGHLVRDPARDILESQGYAMLFQNVRFWQPGLNNTIWEDWWIDPRHFDQKILACKNSGLFYFECVDALQDVQQLDYVAQHEFCAAYAEEYNVEGHNYYWGHYPNVAREWQRPKRQA
jgi:hypothetical protein